MAKRKIKKDSKPEIKNTTTVISGSQGIVYEGQVKVSLQKGNKTIFTKQSHNAGCKVLFDFIAKALAGTFDTSIIPSRIMFFGKAETESPTETYPAESLLWNDATSMTSFILKDTTPKVTDIIYVDSANNNHLIGKNVAVKFKIPCGYISTESTIPTISKKAVAKLGLFTDQAVKNDTGITDYKDELSAYFLLTTLDENNKVIWAPITIPETDVDKYTFLIDWNLKILNRKENE